MLGKAAVIPASSSDRNAQEKQSADSLADQEDFENYEENGVRQPV